MNKNQPLILGFSLNQKQIAALRVFCIKCNLSYQSADVRLYGETIGVLCGLDPRTGREAPKEPLREPMLVFAHMETDQINRFLSEARRAKLSRPSLLAMLTETNRFWTPAQLEEQLIAERTAIQTKMASIHANEPTPESVQTPDEKEENDHA